LGKAARLAVEFRLVKGFVGFLNGIILFNRRFASTPTEFLLNQGE
jgi:hypothetical protein